MQTPYLSSDAPLDFVEELKLRRWARQNYVSPADRPRDWHPVIREEMQLRDAEMIVKSRVREPASSYVPLAPTGIQRIHAAHASPEEPKSPLANEGEAVERYEEYARA